MKKVLVVVCVVALMSFAALSASAQTPNVQVYFDANLTQTQSPCPAAPAGTIFGSLFVVANNFGSFINAIEYQIVYPPQLGFVGDTFNTPLVVGNSAIGVSVAWAVPQNAFAPLIIGLANILWLCQDCPGPNVGAQIVVIPSPLNLDGKVQAVQWPTNIKLDGIGQTSLLCTGVPTEETTWGGIKALYK
jgi:hypothetical protein